MRLVVAVYVAEISAVIMSEQRMVGRKSA